MTNEEIDCVLYGSELEAKLLKAAEFLDTGRGTDGEQVFAPLRQRSKESRNNG